MTVRGTPPIILLLLPLLGIGCRTQAPPLPPERSPLQVDVAPAARRVDPPFAGIPSAHVPATGCRFVGATTAPLRLAFRGELFAVATTPKPVTLTLGGRSSSIVFSVFGWDLDVGMEEDGVPLHAQEPLGFAGVYDPFSAIDLHWKTAPTFQVLAPIVVGPSFVGAPPTLQPRCEAVGLAEHNFPERPRPPAPATWYELAEDTELSATETGPTVAVLPKGAAVAGYGNGSKVEIVYRKDGYWRGWVARTSLRAGSSDVHFGRLAGRHYSPRRFEGFKCPSPLALYLRKAGDHFPIATLGFVRAGTHVAFETAQEGYRPLADEQRTTTSELGSFACDQGYEIVVDEAAAAVCTTDHR